MPTSSMTPTAVANALKGEKSFQTVEFPITGDNEIDAISGCRAVLNRIGISPHAEGGCSVARKRSSETARYLEAKTRRGSETALIHGLDGWVGSNKESTSYAWDGERPGNHGPRTSSATPYPSRRSSMAMDDMAILKNGSIKPLRSFETKV